MSGRLPPRTAVSTFCSESSLFTYRLVTFSLGGFLFHTLSRCANVFASAPVEPSQIVRPLLLAVLLLSVPQAARPNAMSEDARATRSQRLVILLPSCPRLARRADPRPPRGAATSGI